MDRTLVICKPDAVERGLVGEIVGRLERKGLTHRRRSSCARSTRRPPARHYAEHDGKPFFGDLVAFITRGPAVLMVVEGPEDTWKVVRTLMGATNPARRGAGHDPRRSRRSSSPRTSCTARRPGVGRARDRHLLPRPVTSAAARSADVAGPRRIRGSQPVALAPLDGSGACDVLVVRHGPRHGRRPRHGQHPRLRARPRASCSTSRRSSRSTSSDGRPLAVGARGQADDRPHAGPHPGHPAAEGRRHRRLRDLREDAPLLHPQGAPAPLGQAAHGDLRAVGHHRRRAARRAGGGRVRRRPQAGLHHRGADGRGDRRRACRCRSRPAT